MPQGTRVRLRVATLDGWKGTGTVIEHCGEHVTMVKDGRPLTDWFGRVDCCDYEVAVLKKQGPHNFRDIQLIESEP